MIADQDFAVGIDAETRDLQSGAGQFLVPYHLGAVMLHAPDFAGRIITVDVGALQVRKACTVVDDAASQRTELGVMMLDGRLDVRRRPELATRIKRMAAFVDAPAVVFTFADQVGLL